MSGYTNLTFSAPDNNILTNLISRERDLCNQMDFIYTVFIMIFGFSRPFTLNCTYFKANDEVVKYHGKL